VGGPRFCGAGKLVFGRPSLAKCGAGARTATRVMLSVFALTIPT
jgi:hypothetical protein